MSVIPAMSALLERQKTAPSLAFPDEEKSVRKGSFKVSSKLLRMWKDSAKGGDEEHAKGVGQGPHMLLFNKVRDAIDAIPRNDLPTIWNKDNMADAQDFIAMKPKLAFQMWMRNIKKVSPKLQKYIQSIPDNAPLVYYAFLSKVSGKDMADIIFKRHFETESGHPGELKRKKKWDEKKALRKRLRKQGIATEAKMDPSWKTAAEKLMKTTTGKDQESFHKRAYLRAVIQGNSEQATHVAKNLLDPKTTKDLRMKLIDLAGQKESLGLPKDWKRIAGIDSKYRGFHDALHEDSEYDQVKQYLDKEMTPIKTKGIRESWWIPGKAWALNLPFQGAQIHTFTILPLFPGKKAYRPADPDRGIPEGIILNPTWHGAKDFSMSLPQIEKAVELIKTKAPTLEQAVDDDIKWIEQKFGIKVPPAVVARVKKGIEATAKRRWDANMLRQYGQLYPFDGGKPFKLDSWGSLKK